MDRVEKVKNHLFDMTLDAIQEYKETGKEEAAYAMETIPSVSVGPRILRCETAPLAALCAILYETSNFDIGE